MEKRAADVQRTHSASTRYGHRLQHPRSAAIVPRRTAAIPV